MRIICVLVVLLAGCASAPPRDPDRPMRVDGWTRLLMEAAFGTLHNVREVGH